MFVTAAHPFLQYETDAHFTGVKLTPAEEENLRKRWQHAVGPRYDVIVCLSVIRISIKYYMHRKSMKSKSISIVCNI